MQSETSRFVGGTTKKKKNEIGLNRERDKGGSHKNTKHLRECLLHVVRKRDCGSVGGEEKVLVRN